METHPRNIQRSNRESVIHKTVVETSRILGMHSGRQKCYTFEQDLLGTRLPELQVSQPNSTTINMYVAPECVRTLPTLAADGNRSYTLFGWRTVTVKKIEDLHSVGYSFPELFQGATIHKRLRGDVPLLVTP